MPRPNFTAEQAIELVQSKYGLKVQSPAAVKALPSYDDQNFLVTAENDEKFVLKLYNSTLNGNDFGTLDLQNQCMLHLEKHGVRCPRVVPSIDPQPAYTISYKLPNAGPEGDVFFVRLLRFIEGSVMAAVPHTPALLQQLGVYAYRLDTVMQSFQHDRAERNHDWDLANCGRAFDRLIPELSAERASVVSAYRDYCLNTVLHPAMESGQLTKQVIHSDMNDHNLIVDATGENIAGVIDFGDLMLSRRVFNLAICCGYMMLDKEDPIEACVTIASSYIKARNTSLQSPDVGEAAAGAAAVSLLTASELKVLFSCAVLRICVSVCFSNYSYMQEPDNEYLLVTSKPGWKLLNGLLEKFGSPAKADMAFAEALAARLKLMS